jgi:hypothetical protein
MHKKDAEHQPKKQWPNLVNIFELISYPYVGVFICMVIAPIYLFSEKVRTEINHDKAKGRFSLLIFIWIGAILWIALLVIGTLMMLDLQNQ